MSKPLAQDDPLIASPRLFRIMTKASAGLAIALLVLGPASFLIMDDVGGIVWTLTVLAGLVVACATYRRWWPHLREDGRPVLTGLGILLLYLSLSALSYFLVDNSDFAASRVSRQFLLLGAPFVLLLLWWLRLDLRTVLLIIALNASTFGIYAFWYAQSIAKRVEGVVHAVHFGNISLFLAFASLALLPVSRHYGWRILAGAGMLLGGMASLLAGARGGWIAAPVLCIITLIMITRAFNLRRNIVAGLSGLAILVLVGLWHTQAVQKRIYEVHKGLAQLSEANWAKNSIGIRLLMWEQASLEIQQAPLQGTGFSGYRNRMQEAVKSGALPEKMLDFATEPHNEYLYQWLTRGAFGLMFFLFCLIRAGWYFSRLLLRGDSSQLAIAQVGLSLIAIIAIGGLTITVIDQRAVIRFLGWVLALLMYCVWLYGGERRSAKFPRAAEARTTTAIPHKRADL